MSYWMGTIALGAALFTQTAAFAGDDIFISADEAKTLLAKGDARLICSDAERDCAKAHIPGSVFAFSHDLQYLDEVKACKGLPMCEATAAKFLGGLGIDAKTPVIAYDSGLGVNASGNWFLLRLFGHQDVKILEGGLAAWKAKGGAVESGPAAKPAVKTFSPHVQWEMIASLDEVKKATADPAHYLILDARHNLEEYTGKTLQASMKKPGEEFTVPRGGFIPSAVFSPWTKYAGNRSGEPDKPILKGTPELKKQLEKLQKNGYSPEKTVISYCHVGLGRGSFQYIALKKAGHSKVKVYMGSWSEWASDPSLPLGAQP